MKHRYLLASAFLLLALVSAAPVSAQVSDPASKAPVNGPLQESAKPPSDFSQEPLIYEYLRTVMRYENDGSGSRETVARIHVQSPAGLTKAGQLIFDYNASNETVEIRGVRVRKPDGSVVTAGPDAMQDL